MRCSSTCHSVEFNIITGRTIACTICGKTAPYGIAMSQITHIDGKPLGPTDQDTTTTLALA
jgi:hypothetical protein